MRVKLVIRDEQTNEDLWIHEEERNVKDDETLTLLLPARMTNEGLLLTPITVST